MNIVWILHNYPPVVLAGAEFAAHRLNKWLLTQGHTITVYIYSREAYPAEFEGVIIKPLALMDCYKMTLEPDTILVSQLWATRQARPIFDRNPHAKYIEFIHYVDNTVISSYPWTNKQFNMVFNSKDTMERALAIGPWLRTDQVKRHVIPPFLEPAPRKQPRTDPTAYSWITLVNFSKDKGADLLNRMAEEDSTRKYVGIKGSHGIQEAPHASVDLFEPRLDMEPIWEKTRILVVLSTYETWSMVSSEALARGIPVLCANHIPALKENCGEAATYVDRTNTTECLAALSHIESNYTEISAISKRQSEKHLPPFDTYKRIFSMEC